jgi:hypothetical protein
MKCLLGFDLGSAGDFDVPRHLPPKTDCGPRCLAAGGFVVESRALKACLSLCVTGQSLFEITAGRPQLAPSLAGHGYPGAAAIAGGGCVQLAASILGGGQVILGDTNADSRWQQQRITRAAMAVPLAHCQAEREGMASGCQVASQKAVASHSGVQAGETMSAQESPLGCYYAFFQDGQGIIQLAACRQQDAQALARQGLTASGANLAIKPDGLPQRCFGSSPMPGLKFQGAVKALAQGDGPRRTHASRLLNRAVHGLPDFLVGLITIQVKLP